MKSTRDINSSENIKKYIEYISKLNLLGIDTSGVFAVYKTGIINIDIKEFALALDFPKVLEIPNFVTYLRVVIGGMEKVIDSYSKYESGFNNIERIIIPDSVIMDETAYYALYSFHNLKSISINRSQYNPKITKYMQDIRDERIGGKKDDTQ